jgi:GT2 family glycosyltransferase
MLLSVIIPTFKRRETLGLCLKQLAPKVQNVSPDLFEVIVTDDAARGDPPIPLDEEHPWARLVAGPQNGPASNRNNGAKSAGGDWLVFLDDDCLPQPTFLSAYVEAIHKNPDYLVFEGSTLAERPRARLDEEAPINEQGGYLWSCNFMIQRKLFAEMGGFCELYPYACMEDVDFREQLKERDIKFLFVPEARVVHPWRALANEDKFLNMLVVSHAIFYRRYPLLRPSLFTTCRMILRGWIVALFVEAPSLKFRGFTRYMARQSTLTRCHFSVGQSPAEPNPHPKSPPSPNVSGSK